MGRFVAVAIALVTLVVTACAGLPGQSAPVDVITPSRADKVVHDYWSINEQAFTTYNADLLVKIESTPLLEAQAASIKTRYWGLNTRFRSKNTTGAIAATAMPARALDRTSHAAPASPAIAAICTSVVTNFSQWGTTAGSQNSRSGTLAWPSGAKRRKGRRGRPSHAGKRKKGEGRNGLAAQEPNKSDFFFC